MINDIPANQSYTTSTKHDGTGQAILVTNPLDLWYLCQKIRWAKKNPKIAKDGRHLYQRQVTQLILIDNQAFDYKFPYIGEVGFNMTTAIPRPIMSKKRPKYPSLFPLSQYKIIKKEHISMSYPNSGFRSNDYEFDVMSIEEGISKSKLETGLDIIISEEMTSKSLGILRIPDVVRIKNFNLEGELRYQQGNIDQVIEIKFGKDRLSKVQQAAYETIAGSPSKFRLLEDKQCECEDCSRKWEKKAKSEPAYFRAMLGSSPPEKTSTVTKGNTTYPEPVIRPNFDDLLNAEYQELHANLPPILESLIATKRDNWLKGASGRVEPVYVVEEFLFFARTPILSQVYWVLKIAKLLKFVGAPVRNIPVRLSSSSAGSLWKLSDGSNMTIRVVLNKVEHADVIAPATENSSIDATNLYEVLYSAEGVTMLFWFDQIYTQ